MSDPAARQNISKIVTVLKFGIDQLIQNSGINKLEMKNTTVSAEHGQDDKDVNQNSQFSRKDAFKVMPLTMEKAVGLLNQVDKLLEPLANLSGVINATDGNVMMKKMQDAVRQFSASLALTLNSGESFTMNGTSMQVTIVKYDSDTKPKGNITQTTKTAPTNNQGTSSTSSSSSATQSPPTGGRNLQSSSSSNSGSGSNNKTSNTTNPNPRPGSGLIQISPVINMTGLGLKPNQAIM